MSFDGPKNLMSFDGPSISCLLIDPSGPSKDMSAQNGVNIFLGTLDSSFLIVLFAQFLLRPPM